MSELNVDLKLRCASELELGQFRAMTALRTDFCGVASEKTSSVEIPYASRMPSTVQDSMTVDFEEDPKVAAGIREMILAEKVDVHAREFYSSQYEDNKKRKRIDYQKTLPFSL